jgi:hypothetical protein
VNTQQQGLPAKNKFIFGVKILLEKPVRKFDLWTFKTT